MKLNYGLEPTVEETPEVSYPYKSERKSDTLRDFISMQQTVNAVLSKDMGNDNMGANKPGEAALQSNVTGGAWSK